MSPQERTSRPALAFMMPKPEPRGESAPEPAATATEERVETLDVKAAPDPERVDPRSVADRVYELMQEELRLSRMRQRPY